MVCRKCHRWNLTPLEERWEAIETCERIFRDTRTRASTDNIGIARHREGLDLVRIGKPPRGEFAAWRYGDQFGKRMRRAGSHAPLPSLGGGWLLVGLQLPFPVMAAIGGLGGTAASFSLVVAWAYLRPMARVRVGGKANDE